MQYIKELQNELVNAIKVGSYTKQPTEVYKDFIPQHEGDDQPFVCVVNPAAVEDSKMARCSSWMKSIELRVLVRDYVPVRGDLDVADGQEAEVDVLLTVCQEIKDHIRANYYQLTAGGISFVLDDIVHDPLYDYSLLLESSTFISSLSFTYKGMV